MTERYSILLVEDDPLIARTVAMGLPFKGFDVTVCNLCEECRAMMRQRSFDVVLIDISLPDGDGIALCIELRAQYPALPLLLVTARNDEASAVAGIESGADDYVRKPYGLAELAARIKRLLVRQQAPAQTLPELRASTQNDQGRCLQFGELTIDYQRYYAELKGIPLTLGKREFKILWLMVRKAGSVVSRNDILDTLNEDSIYDRTIDSHISHLRKKLKDCNGNLRINAVYGVGYRLEKT